MTNHPSIFAKKTLNGATKSQTLLKWLNNYIYIYVNTHTYTYAHIYTYVYVCIYIFVCVYIFKLYINFIYTYTYIHMHIYYRSEAAGAVERALGLELEGNGSNLTSVNYYVCDLGFVTSFLWASVYPSLKEVHWTRWSPRSLPALDLMTWVQILVLQLINCVILDKSLNLPRTQFPHL